MARTTCVAVLLVLALAATACNRPVASPRARAPQREEWRPYDDLSANDLSWGTPPRLQPAAAFDLVRSGMTLGELVETLGRGDMWVKYSGTGTISWQCDDGRELSVLPISYRQGEIIRVDGGAGGIGRMWMTAERRTRTVDIPAK